jgi:hypothetical protein
LAVPGPEAENQKTNDEDGAGVAKDFGRKHFRRLSELASFGSGVGGGGQIIRQRNPS